MPTIPPTQYKLTDNLKGAIVSVLSAGQNYVPSVSIRSNRSDVFAQIPRLEVDVTNVARASLHLAPVQIGNQVVVASAGTSGANGIYTESGTHSGRPSYEKSGYHIQWHNGHNYWQISSTSPSSVLYTSTSATTYPYQASYEVTNGTAPAPSVTQASGWFYDHFASDVTIKVVTDRADATASNHDDVVQSVRYLMSREAQTLISPVVTWYDVLDVVEQGESHEIDAENREDHSTISFRLELGILASSYAVPSTGSAL